MRNGLANAVTRVFPCFDRCSKMRLRVGSASAKNTAVILSCCLATRLTIRYRIMSSKVSRKGKYPLLANAARSTAAARNERPSPSVVESKAVALGHLPTATQRVAERPKR